MCIVVLYWLEFFALKIETIKDIWKIPKQATHFENTSIKLKNRIRKGLQGLIKPHMPNERHKCYIWHQWVSVSIQCGLTKMKIPHLLAARQLSIRSRPLKPKFYSSDSSTALGELVVVCSKGKEPSIECRYNIHPCARRANSKEHTIQKNSPV